MTYRTHLTWAKHITEVVSKARVMSGWVLKTFSTRDRDPMSPSPNNLGNIDLLENTQRTFTRNINGMEGLDYAQRLDKLNMYSVQRSQERYKIIYTYKIKEGLVPNISETHGLQFLPNERHGYTCRIPKFPLYLK